ncbi:MAG: 4Fe-4S binding protein [Tabrizicola sp.]|nr:4Fe-4S binding protein [Tabrizicola sp.]
MHGLLAQARCSACADACPQDALQMTAEGLVLDPAACTGCGACVAACPQRAVALDGQGGIRPEPSAGGPEAALVCPRRGPGQGPCLQELGLEALARLWLQGVRRIAVLTADCAACPDGAGLPVAARVAALNALLEDRGLQPLRIGPVASVPRRMPRLTAEPVPRRGRRLFLGLGAVTDTGIPALARLQSLPGPPGARHACAPRIDPARCTGCDACLRICPAGALSLIKDDDGGLSYGADPSGCTGCGMCEDVCGAGAMTIERLAPAVPGPALVSFRCRGCGVEVHVPSGGPREGGGLCPVCARTGHHRRLFQVLP